MFYLEAKLDNTVGRLPRTEHPCLKCAGKGQNITSMLDGVAVGGI